MVSPIGTALPTHCEDFLQIVGSTKTPIFRSRTHIICGVFSLVWVSLVPELLPLAQLLAE
jgi:hypothetical protein